MEILGIQFAPLHVPWQRRLQVLAAGAGVATMVLGGLIGAIFLIYLIFYTHHWPEALFYLCWAYKIDKGTPEKGGRPIEQVRDWIWWKYVKDYFPIRLERVPWVELDPRRNYLFCCFPHGFLPIGLFSAFGSNWGGFRELFPHHSPHLFTLKQNFLLPILRELLISVGMLSASAKSIDHLLSYPGGGKVGALVVGGAAETFHCKHGLYRIILKKRKGFVRLALKNGSPLVPVFSFGETDIYSQTDYPEGSMLHRIQLWLKNVTGIAPVIPLGRGFFQYSFGMVPLRKPISTVVGRPIEVTKVDNPTKVQIDELHAEFMKQIANLFEEQKYHYIENAKETTLIID